MSDKSEVGRRVIAHVFGGRPELKFISPGGGFSVIHLDEDDTALFPGDREQLSNHLLRIADLLEVEPEQALEALRKIGGDEGLDYPSPPTPP